MMSTKSMPSGVLPVSPLVSPATKNINPENAATNMGGHITATNKNLIQQQLPLRKECDLALQFQFRVMKGFIANPRQWYKRERAQLLNDRSLQNGGRRYTNIAPASGLNATRPPRTYNQALKNSSIKKSRLKLWLTVEAPAGPIRVKPSRKDNNYSSVRDFCPPPDILPKAIQDQAEGL
ncbi:hypothetical protein B0O99DRAFT_679153 [Bisporella sp. PMI_857]|nr:hypothetical protein B0O99DRAFT_679153 [Bisporella sp. PMI_857]